VLLSVGACGEQEESFRPVVPEIPAIPLGLDPYLIVVPDDNPIEPEKVALGWQLFYDPRLSANEDIHCASCHVPAASFSDPRPRSEGAGGAVAERNTPPIINAALNPSQFWDGRSPSLEDQALEPILNPIEMANTLGGLLTRLNTIPGYRRQFKEIFGADTIDADLVGKAIATFERVLLAGNSPWDRWEQAGNTAAVSDAARRGEELFRDRARCNRCHLGSNYTDAPFGRFHNLGVGMDSPNPDLGRYGVSGRDEERGAFRTPTLRQVAQTAPYMHDGSLGTLEEVIELYDRGGDPNPWLDPEMRPLNLTTREKADLVAFLRALTGEPPAWALRPPPLPPG
jgi:cytochrome c peroxidase